MDGIVDLDGGAVEMGGASVGRRMVGRTVADGNSVGGEDGGSIGGFEVRVGGVAIGVSPILLVIMLAPDQECYHLCIEHCFPDSCGMSLDRCRCWVEGMSLLVVRRT